MYSRTVFLFGFLSFLAACQSKEKVVIPEADADNGGLFLPDGFGALVVADSVGPSRHIAVNDNGDIYVKLRITTGNLFDYVAGKKLKKPKRKTVLLYIDFFLKGELTCLEFYQDFHSLISIIDLPNRQASCEASPRRT